MANEYDPTFTQLIDKGLYVPPTMAQPQMAPELASMVPSAAPIGQNTVIAPATETPAYIPPIEAAPMVQQALEAPTFDYQQDRQARFDALKEEALKQYDQQSTIASKQALGPNQLTPFDQNQFPGKSREELAEDQAMDRLLQEDADIQAFQEQTRAATEAEKAAQSARAQKAAQLGIALPTEQVMQVQEAIATPTAPEIAAQEITIRQETAKAAAQDRVAKQQAAKEADDDIKIKQEADKKVEDVELSSLSELMQKGSFGQKLGAALAVLAGGYSQGLTGAKSNPVLDFMEKNFEQVMSKRKFRADQEAAAKEAYYKNAQLLLQQNEHKLKKRLTDAQIDEIYGKLAQAQADARDKLMTQLKLKYGKITDPLELGKNADRAVRLPDGSYRIAVNKKQASELEKYRAEVEPALSGISRLKEIGRTYSSLNPVGQAAANTELSAIVGSLRLPITGPGVLTDSEREMLKEIIGNPLKISSLSVIENKKLDTIQNKLDKDLKQRYHNAGIDLPQNRKEQAVQYLMKNHNLSESKAKEIVDKRMAE